MVTPHQAQVLNWLTHRPARQGRTPLKTSSIKLRMNRYRGPLTAMVTPTVDDVRSALTALDPNIPTKVVNWFLVYLAEDETPSAKKQRIALASSTEESSSGVSCPPAATEVSSLLLSSSVHLTSCTCAFLQMDSVHGSGVPVERGSAAVEERDNVPTAVSCPATLNFNAILFVQPTLYICMHPYVSLMNVPSTPPLPHMYDFVALFSLSLSSLPYRTCSWPSWTRRQCQRSSSRWQR